MKHGASVPDDYVIRNGYTSRTTPAYFTDVPSAVIWQPDVYSAATTVARALGATKIVDVGCGSGQKLVALSPEFELVGIDFGPNIEWCRANWESGTWIEHDLDSSETLPEEVDVTKAVVVCADVVEHVVRPAILMRKLGAAMERGAVAVVISTPERDLTYGVREPGPPLNPAHLREWTIREFAAFARRCGFSEGSVGLTRSNNFDHEWHTILAVYTSRADSLGTAEEALIDMEPPQIPPPAPLSVAAEASHLVRRIASGLRRRLGR